ncbi:hypothetical protein, partial [Arthrobacter mangrovi]|uniref:hypothetical protein n=1 Tax=Arthrobacter mangrovi TaxID=2966350 RepID=UPI0022323183
FHGRLHASDWEAKIKDAWALERQLFKGFGWELRGNGQDEPEGFWRTGSEDLFRQRIARFQLENEAI